MYIRGMDTTTTNRHPTTKEESMTNATLNAASHPDTYGWDDEPAAHEYEPEPTRPNTVGSDQRNVTREQVHAVAHQTVGAHHYSYSGLYDGGCKKIRALGTPTEVKRFAALLGFVCGTYEYHESNGRAAVNLKAIVVS
jgi:hypothetical protein